MQRVEEELVEADSELEGGDAGTEEDEKEDDEEDEDEGEEQEGEGEGEGEEDCDDPDSAYVNAMEKIWAEAEAWVDAEAQVPYCNVTPRVWSASFFCRKRGGENNYIQ